MDTLNYRELSEEVVSIKDIPDQDEPTLINTEVVYPKSNFLIGAKYRSSLMENKIMAIALSQLRNGTFTDNGIVVSMTAAELKELLKANNGSFYSSLQKTASTMTGRSMGFSDPKKQRFDYIAVVIRATYENGVFTLKFNPDLKNYVKDLSENFTKLKLKTMLEFESTYSFRLYELLKSQAFHPKYHYGDRGNTFNISFTLAELKLCLGVVNAELDAVKKELSGKKVPDYERAVEIAPERQFDTWYKFRTKLLDVARKEINEKTDIEVDYTLKRSGRGGKVSSILFIVKYANRKSIITDLENEMKEENENRVLTLEEKEKVLDEISEMIQFPAKLKDLRAIAEAAEYDILRVNRANNILMYSKTEIRDPLAFMIAAIKDTYLPNKYMADELRKNLGVKSKPQKTSEMDFDKNYNQMSLF